MFGLSGLAARVVYAILAGIVTFIVLEILGYLVALAAPSLGTLIEKFAVVVAVLVGLLYFFRGPGRGPAA